jgi:adhesin transport system outer membrane protein
MLRLRYNLFRGGTDVARVREAEARIDEALANYGKARNDIERNLRQAWEGLAIDRERLPQLQRYAAASAQVVSAYRKQFSIGQRTLLDVLNAENELYSARSSRDSGAHAVTLDELRVLAAMGKLLEALGVSVDAPPPTLLAREPAPAPAATPLAHDEADAVAIPAQTGVPAEGAREQVGREQRGMAVATSLHKIMSQGSDGPAGGQTAQ